MRQKLVVTYELPPDTPEWLYACLKDGDYSGVMEYMRYLHPEGIELENG